MAYGVKIPTLSKGDMVTDRNKPMYAMGRLAALSRVYGVPTPFAVQHPTMHSLGVHTGGLTIGALSGLVMGALLDNARSTPDEPNKAGMQVAGSAAGGLVGLLLASKQLNKTRFRAAERLSDELRMSPVPPDASSYTKELLQQDPEEGEADPLQAKLTGTSAYERGKLEAYRQFLARNDTQQPPRGLADDPRSD